MVVLFDLRLQPRQLAGLRRGVAAEHGADAVALALEQLQPRLEQRALALEHFAARLVGGDPRHPFERQLVQQALDDLVAQFGVGAPAHPDLVVAEAHRGLRDVAAHGVALQPDAKDMAFGHFHAQHRERFRPSALLSK